MSIESITNTPKPVTFREGFYKCIDANPRRDSVSTVSTLESELDEPTPPTSWSSPGSSGKEEMDSMRIGTFGEKEDGIVVARELVGSMPVRMSRVGVAF
jgi:hypothetical protein